MIRQSHPSKGKFGSGNRGRQDLQPKIANAADQWGDPWVTQQTPQRGQGMQWPTTQPNAPTPMNITITDPEDMKWLQHATSSGINPAQVITMCRKQQHQHSQNQTNPEQTPRISSSLLPTGLVACNDCGYVASTFELADRHQQEAHPRLANGPDGRN